MKKSLVSSMGILMLGLGATTQAALVDRGNGMIYDSDQGLTWLQDTNYAMTSGYDADGFMNWHQAVTWADGLNFGGYDDWRLPTVVDIGTPGENWSYNGTDAGYNVDTSSELAYMFHINLGNESYYNTNGSWNADGCAYSSPLCLLNTNADGVDILNLLPAAYWSGADDALDNTRAWFFGTNYGRQSTLGKYSESLSWAVRDGDVGATTVPVPGTLVLMLSGLAGLGVLQRRHTSLR
ncbi:MAG: DUF1566 domain-containing protein [Candidatus Thiodiazotropha sp. (ex Codakia orbicularis)]|nr:DUF1566 domain-containing protein [Candidatus Thiodiazotropha sp. (ex Codakia orbicularis)]